jgi:hypothetical protein
MWWWWVFTFIHNCVWIFWFIAKNAKKCRNSKNEFQWITKHFFGKTFSYTCDLYFKLDILNPLNTIFLSNGVFQNPFLCSPFLHNLRTLKFLYNLFFHQVHVMNIYFHKGAMFLFYKKIEINCMILCILFYSLKNIYIV